MPVLPLIAPAGAALLKLAGGTAALSGAGLGAYGLSQIPNSIKEGILSQGPNDPSDPTKFKTNPLQNLLIDEENLSNEYFKRQQTKLYNNDAEVRKRANLLGQTAKDIGTRSAGAYLADTKEEAERITTNKDLTKQLQGMDGGYAIYAGLGENPTNAMLRQGIIKADKQDPYGGGRGTLMRQEQIARDEKVENRRRFDVQRMDRLEDLLREQRNRTADRQDQRDLNRMQFDLQNRRLDMQEARDYRLDRQKAIMQIVQGFKQMGQAFAY